MYIMSCYDKLKDAFIKNLHMWQQLSGVCLMEILSMITMFQHDDGIIINTMSKEQIEC